ncbi:unnamed protein product [Adineta ricciae]|uniref:N-acetyltransferase domain-containing protein n=1 Tax=Adineta ricciae TaxID=249248 RepID=A0A813NSF3_ADIRI|nr:unnamed protein product [Adineta ricciae]CAF0743920.1 unnamed protein product [Adineta ricciae]
MSDEEYVYEVISNENDALFCARLIAEEFCASNPITVFDGVKTDCFFQDVSWLLMQDMLEEGLSFLARHRSSGEIVGAVVAGDLYIHHQKYAYDPSSAPQSIPASDLLDEMDHLFVTRDFQQELKANLVLHITVAAVRRQHSGKNVAYQMNVAMCDYARNRHGFQYAFVQVTNPATRHIYVDKMNGIEVTIVDPTSWVWKKKHEGSFCPYKDYQGGLIPNILIKLNTEDKK